MNTQAYHVERDEIGYMVTSSEGEVTCYESMEDAFAASREFSAKTFPENWNKIPPSILAAKRQYYGAAA